MELLKLYGSKPLRKSWNKKAIDVKPVVKAKVTTKVVQEKKHSRFV